MEFDFVKTMQQATDAELLKIVTIDRANYQEVALIAAEAELAKRNLTSEQINTAKSFNEKEQKIQTFKANSPLEMHWKILTFILPGIFQIILSGTFKGDGYDRKANELVKWTFYGFGFYIGLVLLLKML